MRRACGVWDESPLQKWELRGPDATVVADRWFTNDVRSLQTGQLRYGAFCDDNGAMLGDGTVFRFGLDRLLAVTALPSDRESLDAAAAGADVEIECLTDRMPHLQLQGPASRDVLQSLASADVSTLGYYRFLPEPIEVAGLPVTVARCGLLGRAGIRAVLRPAARRGAVAGAARHRQRDAVRPECRRDAAPGVGADLHRLRLLRRGDRPLRGRARQSRQARQAGVHAVATRCRSIAASPPPQDHDARDRGGRGAGVRGAGDGRRSHRGRRAQPQLEPHPAAGHRACRTRPRTDERGTVVDVELASGANGAAAPSTATRSTTRTSSGPEPEALAGHPDQAARTSAGRGGRRAGTAAA